MLILSDVFCATLYLVLAYAIASSWESWFHGAVIHARQTYRQRWRCWGNLGALLRLAHFYHHTIHHRRTYLSSYFVQFDTLAQQQKLDARLKGSIASRVQQNRYGLTVNSPFEILAFTGIPLLLNTLTASVLAPNLIWAGIAISLMPLALSRYLHPLLHTTNAPDQMTAGIGAIIRSTRAFRFLQRYHLDHHVYGCANFNLLLGADALIFRKKRDELSSRAQSIRSARNDGIKLPREKTQV